MHLSIIICKNLNSFTLISCRIEPHFMPSVLHFNLLYRRICQLNFLHQLRYLAIREMSTSSLMNAFFPNGTKNPRQNSGISQQISFTLRVTTPIPGPSRKPTDRRLSLTEHADSPNLATSNLATELSSPQPSISPPTLATPTGPSDWPIRAGPPGDSPAKLWLALDGREPGKKPLKKGGSRVPDEIFSCGQNTESFSDFCCACSLYVFVSCCEQEPIPPRLQNNATCYLRCSTRAKSSVLRRRGLCYFWNCSERRVEREKEKKKKERIFPSACFCVVCVSASLFVDGACVCVSEVVMPHVGTASGGDDLASTDEIKVFKEEGDEEDNRSSENLTELKTSLVTEGEEVRHRTIYCRISIENCNRSHIYWWSTYIFLRFPHVLKLKINYLEYYTTLTSEFKLRFNFYFFNFILHQYFVNNMTPVGLRSLVVTLKLDFVIHYTYIFFFTWLTLKLKMKIWHRLTHVSLIYIYKRENGC